MTVHSCSNDSERQRMRHDHALLAVICVTVRVHPCVMLKCARKCSVSASRRVNEHTRDYMRVRAEGTLARTSELTLYLFTSGLSS